MPDHFRKEKINPCVKITLCLWLCLSISIIKFLWNKSLKLFFLSIQRKIVPLCHYLNNNSREVKIIHVDMDQFFAAVEQRDNPELKGKPIAVGHDAERGVVSTASYEARRFGVHSAQSIQVAKRLCPHLIIVDPHFQRYKEVSAQLHEIFHDYTDLIEPISLDEAFLDVTENKKEIELGVDIAREIKQRIRETTELTASAGVSYCKFLAKIASDWRKPDGLTVIHPDRALDFIAQLKVDGHFYRTGSEDHVTHPADAGVRQDGAGVL